MRTRLASLAFAAALALPTTLAAQAAASADRPYTVEYYYKMKWGFQEEWMELYKRNHYPVLVRQQEMGRIVGMSAITPIYHAGEANRWDLRFTITWKNVDVANDDFDASTITRVLYPDRAKFLKEEQRRFELLVEHLDVPVAVDDLKAWARRPGS